MRRFSAAFRFFADCFSKCLASTVFIIFDFFFPRENAPQYAMLDTAAREFLFCGEFFGVKDSRAFEFFKAIMVSYEGDKRSE